MADGIQLEMLPASAVGGAISIQGNSPNQQVTNNFFIGDNAQLFFGGAVSQEPCDPTFVGTGNVLSGVVEVSTELALM